MKRPDISEAMALWHASRTPEQKEVTRLRQTDAAVCRLFTVRSLGNRYGRLGTRPNMDLNTPVGNTTLRELEKASISRIMKDIARTELETVREALLDGIRAPPPR